MDKYSRIILFIILPTLLIMVFVDLYINRIISLKPKTVLIGTSKPKDKQVIKAGFTDKIEYSPDAGDKTKYGQKVLLGIIPNQPSEKDFIDDFFSYVDPELIQRVIIIGSDVNHILGNKPLLYYITDATWETPFGFTRANDSLVSILLANNMSTLDLNIFIQDNSISPLTPFIKKYLPNVEIVPIILKTSQEYKPFFNTGRLLHENTQIGDLLLISTNFSYKEKFEKVMENDKKSIKSLYNLSLKNLGNVTCECREWLAYGIGFLSSRQDFVRFEVIKSSSLSFLADSNEDITDYITAYYSDSKNELQILFTGDLMMDRYIRENAEKKGYDYILDEISPFLKGADLVVSDLEGPITSYDSISKYSVIGSKENYIFTFDPVITDTLSMNKIKLVNIGNNHIGNFGNEGIEQTIKNLNDSEISFFGDLPGKDYDTSFEYSQKDTTITFINYNEFAEPNLDEFLNRISEADKKTDFVIVYTHWGIEYSTTAGQYYIDLAHQFIDYGTDAVIGSHPHVIQQKEIYKEKPIYYSLGNFVMDQYFEDATKRGLIVKLYINTSTKELYTREVEVKLSKCAQTEISNYSFDM